MTFAACQEEMIPVTDDTTDGATLKDYPVEMDFTATTEMGTKTTLNGTTVSWEAEDQIKVLWEGGSNVAKTEEGGAEASFSTRVDEGVTEFWAAYPYSESTVLEDGKLVVNIPSEQSGVFAGANYSVAKTSGSLLEFKHLVGLVEVSTSLENASRITIKGAENDVLAGVITVSGFNAETGLPEYEVAEGAKEIVLEVSGAGTYYAALIPTAELKCLSVCVETTDGENATSDYALSANTLKMERAKVMALGNVDSRLGKNYFVTATADGTGDGKTWETAFTYQQMAKMLSANRKGALSDDYSDEAYKETHKTVHAAEIHEHTFHMAAGTYQSANYLRIKFAENDSPVKIFIKGGYDPDSKGTDLSQRSGAENITKIKGALGEEGGSGTKRVFLINHGVNLILERITLADGTGDATYGGGAVFMDKASSTLTCKNCVISDNTSPINGAAIYATAGTLDFKGCTFSKNKGTEDSTYGGAIYAKTVSLTCTECEFTENESINNGGAVWLSGMTKADFTDCNFTNNHSDNLAGAICLSGANPLNITGGTFSGNNSTKGGGCLYNNAASTINITGTTFSDNKSDILGGVFYNNNNAGPVITITDAVFENNEAKTEGGAIIFKAGTWTISGSTFKGNKATSNGGAIYAHTGSLSLTGGSFSDNTTTQGSVGGGAIYVTSSASLSVDGTAFTSNSAQKTDETGSGQGGAISIWESAAASHSIKNATFTFNTDALAGGAIFIKSKKVEIDGCTFEGNKAKGHGGAFNATGSAEFSISNSVFKDNKLTEDFAGAALYSNTSASGSIISTEFTGNSNESGHGGALYWSGTGRLSVDGSHFEGNFSQKQGAVIKITQGTVYFNSSSFTGNKSAGERTGGVMRIEGGKLFVNNSCFHSNTGDKAHTDLVLCGGATTVLNSTLYESDETMACVRLYNDGVVANLYNNVLLNPNTSENEGTVRVGYWNNPGSIESKGYNYTTAWEELVNDSVTGSITMDDKTDVPVDDYSVASALFSLAETADGRGYYKWAKPSDVTGTTAENVTSFLTGVTGGADFLTWLGTVNGLTQDIVGNARPETGWYPGCYQGK